MTALEIEPALIPARTERQAMDWSLVLASEGIEVTLQRDAVSGHWSLLVAPADEERARGAIRQYCRENRGFGWHREVPGTGFWFDGRVFLWALAVALVFAVTQGPFEPGLFDTQRVRAGEWWRAFTAVWLHRDVAHLFSNIGVGVLFLGLATARFGVGVALFGSFLAGALANAAGLVLRGEDYRGLGASGMVMAALGLLVAQGLPRWRAGRLGNRVALTSLGAGAFLFILLGVDQSSDILAHAGGMVFGFLIGLMAVRIPDSRLPGANVLAMAAFTACATLTWFLALRH